MPPTRQFGYKNRKLLGAKLGERGFKTILDCVAKAAA